jgi:hypothetical protein
MRTVGNDLLIEKDELETLSRQCRAVARLLASHDYREQSEEMSRLGDQMQNAACGYEANVAAAPYDEQPDMVEAMKASPSKGET